MKLNKKNKILALILGILVAVTALISLAFSIYPYLFLNHVSKVVTDILTVINFVLPITGIAIMLTFIYRREKN